MTFVLGLLVALSVATLGTGLMLVVVTVLVRRETRRLDVARQVARRLVRYGVRS